MAKDRYYQALDNMVDDLSGFRTQGIRYTVSGRRLAADIDAVDALRLLYNYVDFGQIESAYGAMDDASPLYGGWLTETKRNSALTHDQVEALARHEIGFILALTNHDLSEAAYEASRGLLEKYHRRGNGVICVNDELAVRIRADYPDYVLEASSIKNLNTDDKIERALGIYDYVVLPAEYNKSDEFLRRLSHKDRIILFGNSICAHGCPTRECYREVSKRFQKQQKLNELTCFKWTWRPNVSFDVKKFHEMGFSFFKLIPIHHPQTEQLLREYREQHGIQA